LSAVPWVMAAALTLVIFMILPFTQMFSSARKELLLLRPVEVVLPPPPPPPPPPKEEDKPREKDPELKEKPRPLTLSQLEVALNPTAGGALQSDLNFGFQLGESLTGALEEMKIFELSEVDREPQLVYQAPPQYPPKLYRERVGATVVILFVLDETGAVREPRVKIGSSYREFERAALEAVLKYKFLPGIKDGQPVRVWYEVPFVFSPK
jgi:protein TonB